MSVLRFLMLSLYVFPVLVCFLLKYAVGLLASARLCSCQIWKIDSDKDCQFIAVLLDICDDMINIYAVLYLH